jgi:hypothetical protein
MKQKTISLIFMCLSPVCVFWEALIQRYWVMGIWIAVGLLHTAIYNHECSKEKK